MNRRQHVDYSNPNGKGKGTMPTAEVLDPHLARGSGPALGLCSAPIPRYAAD